MRYLAIAIRIGEKVNLSSLAEPQAKLALLTAKQRAVMDLVCEDFSYKEIAHRLDISIRTVEQRMTGARMRLGTYDRPSTARAYRHLKMICGQTTCGLSPLDFESLRILPRQSDVGSSPVFTLNDAAFSGDVWVERAGPEYRPRGDDFWGRVNRFGMIVLIALGIAAGLAVLIATMNGLNDLL